MQVREIMCENPAVCTRETRLEEVARLMLENDCGAIPLVENMQSCEPIGIITDRDIVCRAVAEGRNPLELSAGDIMSTPCVTVSPDESVDECCKIMEQHQVRRVCVTDEQGACCGIVAQADIARKAPADETAEVVREISKPVAAGAM